MLISLVSRSVRYCSREVAGPAHTRRLRNVESQTKMAGHADCAPPPSTCYVHPPLRVLHAPPTHPSSIRRPTWQQHNLTVVVSIVGACPRGTREVPARYPRGTRKEPARYPQGIRKVPARRALRRGSDLPTIWRIWPRGSHERVRGGRGAGGEGQ